jgi:hypothetical protein
LLRRAAGFSQRQVRVAGPARRSLFAGSSLDRSGSARRASAVVCLVAIGGYCYAAARIVGAGHPNSGSSAAPRHAAVGNRHEWITALDGARPVIRRALVVRHVDGPRSISYSDPAATHSGTTRVIRVSIGASVTPEGNTTRRRPSPAPVTHVPPQTSAPTSQSGPTTTPTTAAATTTTPRPDAASPPHTAPQPNPTTQPTPTTPPPAVIPTPPASLAVALPTLPASPAVVSPTLPASPAFVTPTPPLVGG